MLCGVSGSAGAPVAALTYLEDFGELPPGYCLRADPVHLRADTTGLILFDTATFAVSEAESRALSSTLASHLAADGWDLRFRHPQRWYLVGGPPQDLMTTALPTVRGTAVPALVFSDADAAAWSNRLNEIQMLMHTHPVNQARAAAGQVAVNSLWLWGGGEPQCRGEAHCNHVCATSVFARGCARYRGVAVAALPADADALRASPAADERLLIVLEACRDAAAYHDITAWATAVQRLERDWFAALLRLLRAGRFDTLDLYPLNGRRYRLTRRQLRSFWRGRGDYRDHGGFRCPDAHRV